MKSIHYLILLTLIVWATACETAQIEAPHVYKPYMDLEAPVAKQSPKELVEHGDTRTDNYFWMRLSDEQKKSKTPDVQTQDVLDYLNAENDYLKSAMAHTEELQNTLYDEIVSRIKQDDQSAPVSDNGYSYYTRFNNGADYALYCRKKLVNNATEEIMLNGPEMADGLAYFAISSRDISLDNNLMVYGVDTVSRRQYTLYVKDLNTGKILADQITNTTGSATWANDNKTFFYTKKDPVTLRSYQIYKHKLGTDQSEDELVFEEKDETFSCYVRRSKSDKYLMIGSYQTLSSETRYLDANTPDGEWKIIQPRERNLEYDVAHFNDHFYISTNLDAKNFRLMKTPVNATEKDNWKEVIAHRDDVLLEGFEIFKNHLVISERSNGLTQIRIIKWADNSEHYIKFNDPAYLAYPSNNPEFDTPNLRYTYTSLTTPNSTIQYDMNSKDATILKEQEVLGGNFSSDNYTSERLYANATDGTKIPISLVYKKGTKLDGSSPMLLYAYGSYGSSTNPRFSSVRLSLLDRGFVYAIAHVRGGQEMGRQWYEDGKLLKKKNTFTDFIDCADYLIENKYTSSEHLYASGGSAGGLLMGAIINMRPELWNGVIAKVPWVDAVTTMLDESIPLTTSEFDEWGNPKNKEYYDYMLSYSPYDNVVKQDYPNLLITTGYWDSQVQYWEPAKWCAKLRELKTDNNVLMMNCNMDVGHGGTSGRFQRYKEIALQYAFLLDMEGKEKD